MKQMGGACVLLFSGGRDSTIAAVRLSLGFKKLILVTVTSNHLIGIDAVYRRLNELKRHLSPSTQWLHVLQPSMLPGDQLFQRPTCFPCHRSYTAIGTIVAEQLNANSIAFGYTKYQSAWPEQTPYAVERLADVLASRGIKLELPVYDIASKTEAIAELLRYQFSTESLEQKCIQQQFNASLNPSELKEEITVWEHALRETLAMSNQFQVATVTRLMLGDLSDLG